MPQCPRATGLLLAAAGWAAVPSDGADANCWGGDFNEQLCCRPRWGLTGNPACWDGEYTYRRCCGLDALPRLPDEDTRWDATLRQQPISAEGLEEEYDFIVVGSGSSGSVAAARLAAASGPSGQPWRVLLLEEGSWDVPEDSPNPDVPPEDKSLWRPALQANWSTGTASNTWTYSTGRGLGGTSAVNSMIYTRGSVSEYAAFGWASDIVLEAFRDLEASMEVPGFEPDSKFHRREGKQEPAGYHLSLVSARKEELPPLFRGVIGAFEEVGVPYRMDPHSSDTIHGIGGIWRSMGCGDARCQPTRVSRFRHALGRPRQSPYKTLVAPIQSRADAGLQVVPNSMVERVVFNEMKEAIGVEVSEGGGQRDSGSPRPQRRLYRARREVVLAAGVFGSPKLLTLSGVGDPEELERLGIPLVAESPEVGQNLHEHVGVSIVVGTSVPCPEGYHRTPGGQPTHLGDTRNFIGQLYAFLNASENVPGVPGPVDVEIMVLEGCLGKAISLTLTIMLLRTQSIGRIVVQSRNPFTPPHLDYSPLSHSSDIEVLANTIRLLYTRVLPASQLRQFELTSSPPIGIVTDLNQLAAWIRANVYYYAHPTGTCRIQRSNAEGVVDSELRVLGTQRLRVADASVFPESPSGHSDAPSRLVGQLVSRFMLGEVHFKDGPGGPFVDLHGYSDVKMPLRGLGTNGFTGELARTSVLGFLRLGGRLIDTALLYDNHDDIRGALASSRVPRREIFLVSKLPPGSMGFQEATAAIDRIVSELGTHVDLLLIHWPANWNDDMEVPACARPPGSWKFCRAETWRAMEEAHYQGHARALGVSNFGVRHLRELMEEPGRRLHVAVNQVEMHPWWPQPQLHTFCSQHSIGMTAYGSLGGSLLGGAMLQADSVMDVSRARRRSPAQVLLRWAMQQGVAVIPSSSSEEHLAENLDIAIWELSESDMRLLNSVPPQDRVRVFLPDPDQAP